MQLRHFVYIGAFVLLLCAGAPFLTQGGTMLTLNAELYLSFQTDFTGASSYLKTPSANEDANGTRLNVFIRPR